MAKTKVPDPTESMHEAVAAIHVDSKGRFKIIPRQNGMNLLRLDLVHVFYRDKPTHEFYLMMDDISLP